MKTKIWCALSSIACILVLSSVISVIEYRRVSSDVSALIANDVEGLRVIKNLQTKIEDYNLEVLDFLDKKDSISSAMPQLYNTYNDKIEGLDSLILSFDSCASSSARMLSISHIDADSLEAWYMEDFKPLYSGFNDVVARVDESLYNKLKTHSESFQDAFYRSIIPGMVAVGSGLVLVFLLGYFFLSYYVHPIYKMLNAIEGYKKLGRLYSCKFDGDDQLAELNSALTDMAEENSTLRKRLKSCQLAKTECQKANSQD